MTRGSLALIYASLLRGVAVSRFFAAVSAEAETVVALPVGCGAGF